MPTAGQKFNPAEGRMQNQGPIQPGKTCDGYVVDSVLGKGGNAVVYLVQHTDRGTWHALKVLHNVDSRRRIRIEQEAIFRDELRHPNIVPAVESIDVDGSPGLVMDFVEGPSLAEFLADDPPSDLVWRLHLFTGIVDGVAHAHGHQVIHRDLKPSNVLLQPGPEGSWIPRISDFGLAKAMSPEVGRFGGLTTVNTGLGSAGYAAPEQVRDATRVDNRADLYSLGCILYEFVCGVGPFAGRSTFDTLQAQSAGEFRDPQELAPGLPPALYELVRALLSPDPNGRPDDCRRLSDTIQAILAPIEAPKERRHSRSRAPADRGVSDLRAPLLLCAAPLAALLVGALVVFGT